MSETNPSLVASELAKISTFETETEKRKSTLTLNELNYISDKQLHRKTDGEGGSGDSLVKAADVRFTTDDTTYSGDLGAVFSTEDVFIYSPANGKGPAFVTLTGLNITIANWNAEMDGGVRLVAPQGLVLSGAYYDVSVVSGSAEILEVAVGSVLYITGDCTIQISVTGSEE